MDKEDENFNEMAATRKDYIRTVKDEAVRNGVTVSQWEEEEIEMAYEAGFQRGFVCAKNNRRRGEMH